MGFGRIVGVVVWVMVAAVPSGVAQDEAPPPETQTEERQQTQAQHADETGQEGDASQNTPPSKEDLARDALAEIEGLGEVDVRVVGDSVSIDGVADDPAVREKAAETAMAATGASRVENHVKLSDNLGDRLQGAANRMGSRFEQWLAYLPLIPIAAVVAVLGFVLSWGVGKWEWPYRWLTPNPFLRDIARRVVQAAIVLAGVLLALEILNATALVGGVLGAAGVAGIAIGFAFRDLVENYIASILLSLRQPFRPNDHVLIDGHEGLVTSMNSRTTVLTTFDGNIVRIPNAIVFKSTLTNYSTDARRRFTFDVGVGYDVDLAEAVRVGVEILRETPGVLAEPSPFAIVTALGDSSITVSLFGWVDQTVSDFGKVRSAGMQRVKVEYDRLDIDMPEPIYKIKLAGSVGGALRPEGIEEAKTPPRAAAPSSSESIHEVSKDGVTEAMASESRAHEEGEDLLDASSEQE